MNDEDRKALAETLALERENNKMLHKMRRGAVWSSLFSFGYYFILIAGIFGAYYYVQPYINQITKTYNEIKTGVDDAKTQINSISNLKNSAGSAISPEMKKQLEQILQGAQAK